jgi:NAD(P)-dependent dehydrogenase (short-subunit alcohol dehydrogenase family)
VLDFSGKVVFVSGAGSVAEGWGNGRATAVLLARQGASVFGTDLNPEALAETGKSMTSEGLKLWTAHTADMTVSTAVEAAVKACIDRFGRIDVLINNIGGSHPGDPVSLSEEDWEKQLNRNLTTAFLSMKHVLPVMQKQFAKSGRGGAIVNVSSAASKSFQVGGRVHVAYAASKAGLEALGRATAMAHVKNGIRVNSVIVGMVDTPLVTHRLTKQLGADAERLLAQRNALVPMGRVGTAWDVANAIAFLASDEAGFITATELVVDGGMTASRLSPGQA